MKIQLAHSFEEIISMENLLEAWPEFLRGKSNKPDVQEFSRHLMDNILQLHSDLRNQTYHHAGYKHFKINDPKPRDIHKASVRDRLLHRAIYRVLYSFFNRTFIGTVFSCRFEKGTHKAIKKFRVVNHQISRNNTKNCFILQCDIRKFFANIDQKILLGILAEYLPEEKINWLLREVIHSFSVVPGVGLPLGNLTSQLFVNIYLNKFDQFVKHRLKAQNYIRYCDDFIIAHHNREYLEKLIPLIRNFLREELKLDLHPKKVKIIKLHQGVDFLGYVAFPHHLILRTKTKRRMFRKLKIKKQQLDDGVITPEAFNQSLQSYLGILKHCAGYKIRQDLPALAVIDKKTRNK